MAKQKTQSSFRKKMIFSIVPAMLVVFIILGIVLTEYFYNIFEEKIKVDLALISKNFSSKLESDLAVRFHLEKQFNTVLSKFEDIEINSRRDFYINLANDLLENDKQLLAMWMIFDSNAIDRRDSKYRNSAYSETGRFTVAWYRDFYSEIQLQHINKEREIAEDNAEFTLLPKELKNTTILEPHYYSFDDKKDPTLKTSIVSPIFNKKNEIVGVSGIDLSLESYINFAEQIKPYDVGYAVLYSSGYRYLYHYDNELIGKSVDENPNPNMSVKFMDSIHNALLKEKQGIFYNDYVNAKGEKVLSYHLSIFTGIEGKYIILGVYVPHKVINAQINELLINFIIVIVIALIFIVFIIIVIANKLSLPLNKLTIEAKKIIKGNLSLGLDIHTNDEIGELARTLFFVEQTIQDLIHEVNRITKSAIAGKINVQVDIERFEGAYNSLIKGINEVISIFTEPLDLSSDIIAIIDISTYKFSFAAGSIKEITGFTVEEYLNMTLDNILPPEYLYQVNNIIESILQKYYAGEIDIPQTTFEIKQYDKKGALIWIEVSAKIIINEKNKPDKIVAVVRVVEERKANETKILEQKEELEYQQVALIQQKEVLEKLNITKDKFFSIIAHDLKNPFTALLNISDLLLFNYENMPLNVLERNFTILYECVQNTYGLLENLLKWARSQMNAIVYSPVQVSLAAIISDCANHLIAQATAKNINISQIVKKDYFVNCDVDMILTVLRNLISNAIKFSFNNTTIEVAATDYIEDNDYVLVSVKDAGVGIDDDTINKLFKIDEQIISSKGTNNEGGTGLGLILCREFIDKHNSKIWLESEIGKGTTFFFTLPKYIQ